MQRIINIGRGCLIVKFYKLDKGVKGIKSNCSDGLHTLFMDLDGVNLKYVYHRCKEAIEEFHLSNMHILKSSENSYHVICADKLPFSEILRILAWFDYDLLKHFMIFGIRRHYFVLRCSGKIKKSRPVYVGTVESPYSERKKSRALCKVLRNYYGIPHIGKNLDSSKDIEIDTYATVVTNG